MKYFNAVVVFLLFCSLSLSAQKAFQAPAHDFEPGLLLFKLREQYRGLVSAEGTPHEKMAALIAKVGGGTLRKNFPAAKAPGKEKRKNGRTVVDLSRIFELRLTKQHLDIDSLVGVFILPSVRMGATPLCFATHVYSKRPPIVATVPS